jgi:hypothetical protein
MNKFFLFLFVSLFLFSFASAFGERLDKEITITTIEPTIVTYERHIDYYADTRLDEILEIAVINAGSHEYRLHSYDCTQFSEKLVSLLEDKGYKAQCTAGNSWQSDYTNHTWVSVWIDDVRYEIEATNGNLIEQWVFDEGYYTKWKENYCW